MQPIVYRIHALLVKNRKTAAVAESCTAGLVSKLLTDIAGSSQYFILGAVVYSNAAKESMLKIPSSVIKKNGPVSSPVAALMAANIRKIAKTDFGIGVTGIAGPGRGAFGKPPGTVFISVASGSKKICKEFHFKGGRAAVRNKAALSALRLLKEFLS